MLKNCLGKHSLFYQMGEREVIVCVCVKICSFRDEMEVPNHAISKIWDVCSYTVVWGLFTQPSTLKQTKTKKPPNLGFANQRSWDGPKCSNCLRWEKQEGGKKL